MPLPRTSRMEQEQLSNYVLLVGDADVGTVIYMKPENRVVHVRMTASNTVTIELPPVAEAVGAFYTVRVITFGGGVAIRDKDDSLEWSDKASDANNEFGLFYSDGFQWHVLVTDL